MEAIIAYFSTLAFKEVLILTCLWTLIYIIINKFTQNKMYDEISDIKDSKRGEMNQFIHDELILVEAISLDNARCLLEDYPDELVKFSLVLERSLFFDVMEQIKTLLKINHFHHKTGDALETYISNKAEVLVKANRIRINNKISLFPHLADTNDKRFTLNDGIIVFRKIVMKSIELKKEQDIEIKACKERYSLLHKLNFISVILKLLNKGTK